MRNRLSIYLAVLSLTTALFGTVPVTAHAATGLIDVSQVKVPKGLKIKQPGQADLLYVDADACTQLPLNLTNTTAKTRIVRVSNITLWALASVKQLNYSDVIKIAPHSTETILSDCFKGHYSSSENGLIILTGSVKDTKVAKVTHAGLKKPTGLTIPKLGFDNLLYDPMHNESMIVVTISNLDPTSVYDLSKIRLNGKLTDHVVNEFYLALNMSYSIPQDVDTPGTQMFLLGNLPGDLRTGKPLTLTGSISKVRRTTLNNSLQLGVGTPSPLFKILNISAPEYWKYNKKLNQTTVMATFSPDSTFDQYDISNLSLTTQSSAGELVTRGTLITSLTSGQTHIRFVDLFIVPGDLRTRHAEVTITGTITGVNPPPP